MFDKIRANRTNRRQSKVFTDQVLATVVNDQGQEFINKVGEIVARVNDIIAPTLATQAAPPLEAQNMDIEDECERG
ncbi:hypothetical protein FRC20_007407 [Serendipita sp. 405]|nr:hypothetical protein FRC15_007697 [Serendipita sp. 397]KAG8834778.1 hypothetical protein FRC20_007407 [Serendipita sp. 405]